MLLAHCPSPAELLTSIFFALQFQQVYCSINHTSPVATLQEKKGSCLEQHNKTDVGHHRLGELPEAHVGPSVGGLMFW